MLNNVTCLSQVEVAGWYLSLDDTYAKTGGASDEACPLKHLLSSGCHCLLFLPFLLALGIFAMGTLSSAKCQYI